LNRAPDIIRQLVERFQTHREAYKSPEYNETQVRREFIDPFFKALGWDVDNEKGYAEQWKEVVHEDAIKVGGVTKAPDYSFRLGGRRLFFLEAKRPAVNLRRDPAPAYQVRRYAWTAKMPLSILTDFEEFIVYDTRVRPNPNDRAATARVLYVRCEEYVERWEEIASIFSPEAVRKGAFDKYVESATRKRGTAEVDAAFLAEIEEWRELLARNIALRNAGLSQRELNFAVQRTIDRIIFLRICEDRGIEEYGRLQALLNGERTYGRLRELFNRADERYDSGLFHFHEVRNRQTPPDTLTPGLTIDDRVLKQIIRRLYYPESPYEFAVFPAEILGHVYERFLGSVIRLTPGGRARIEQKPEVRKAGGVYYTPTYIVDYIVKHTVGKLVEGKTPQEVAGVTDAWGPSKTRRPLAVLDPACGSGSFLLGAYQFLLDWHLEQYLKNPQRWAKGKAPKIYEHHRHGWRLTTAERKRILLTNIYGVDIDPQAVEVTKLSLLLKVLEGESAEVLQKQRRLFRERALPDLGANIKCGNSLIGPDFYKDRQAPLFDEEEQYRINAFDWQAEFPQVFGARGSGSGGRERRRDRSPSPKPQPQTSIPRSPASGFDVVIGNPPFIRIQTLRQWAPAEVDYYKKHYKAASKGNYDIYVVFIERGLKLLDCNGRLGFICPHKFFNAKYGESLRKVIADGKHLEHVVHFGDAQVFRGATTYTCLLFLSRNGSSHCDFARVDDLQLWRQVGDASRGNIRADRIHSSSWSFVVGGHAKLYERLMRAPCKLADVAQRLYQGPITSADPVFLFKEWQVVNDGDHCRVSSKALNESVALESGILRPVVRSGDISRYSCQARAMVLLPYEIKANTARLLPASELSKRYPSAWAYLLRNRSCLENREKGRFKGNAWYRFGRAQNLGMWEQRKLMIPYMVSRLAAYLDVNENLYFINVTTGGYGLTTDESRGRLEYLCALLNSKLLHFLFSKLSTTFHGGYYAANKQYLERLPIIPIDHRDEKSRDQEQGCVALVNRMLDLHKRLREVRTDHDKRVIQRQIKATDDEINRLVYELYDLTEDDIKIVEEATAGK